MPIYEYQCRACSAPHEAIQKMSDPPLRRCPACGKAQLKRLISAPMFRLKGGGWYETDFKSDKESKRNLHAEEQPDKAAPASGEAKPAAGADANADSKGEAPKAEANSTAPAGSDGGSEAKPAAGTPSAARGTAKRSGRGARTRGRPTKRR